MPLVEEQVSVEKRPIETGRVRVRTVVDVQERWVRESVSHDNVSIEHVPVGREVQNLPQIRQEGEVLIIPVLEEVLVIEKRLVLKEELHVRRHRQVETVAEPVTVKSMHAVVERADPKGGE